jgi:hypothetical protein
MDCSSIVASASVPANVSGASPDCAKAKEFAEMVDTPQPDADIYVNGLLDAKSQNPLTEIMTQFQSMDFSSKTSKWPDNYEPPSSSNDVQEVEQGYSDTAYTIIEAQNEMLRTVMMMEVMSTTKQGVTTLFQQQG